MTRQPGALIKSLIVEVISVIVSVIVAAVAIPNLLRSITAANQASAVGNIADLTYATVYLGSRLHCQTLGALLLAPPPARRHRAWNVLAIGKDPAPVGSVGASGTLDTTCCVV